jgi:hypothetical protein
MALDDGGPTWADLAEAAARQREVLAALSASFNDLADRLEPAVGAVGTKAVAAGRAASDARRESRRVFVIAVVVVVVALGSMILGVMALIVSNSNSEVIERVDRVIVVINDCTQPGHPCYDESQKRSNDRLGPIVSALCEGVPPERRKPPCHA